MVYLPATLINKNIGNNFTNILFFLSIIGAFVMTKIIKSDSKKYYSVIIMNMDAKKYALSHYIFYLTKTFISFLPALALFTKLCNLSFIHAVVFDVLIIALKIIGDSIEVEFYNRKNSILSKNTIYSSAIAVFGLIIAYGLVYLNITITFNAITMLLPIVLIESVFGIRFLIRNNTYKKIYKNVVTLNSFVFDADQILINSNQGSMDLGNLKLEKNIQNKKGYDYFNSIFFSRHKKILLKSAVTFSLIFIAITITAIFFVITNVTFKGNVHNILMTYLPYFVFIMYIANRGQIITQAMFFNCDHSMLTYKFYRAPSVILNVFKTRLKTLMFINLIPAIVIAIALPLLFYLSGGTNNILIYFGLFLSIIFMSLFFSVHHLVLYYLLQPYDINMKAKSSLFLIINAATYMACYFCMQLTIDTTFFSISTVVATGIYIFIALFLSYKYAPKTFKLK